MTYPEDATAGYNSPTNPDKDKKTIGIVIGVVIGCGLVVMIVLFGVLMMRVHFFGSG